MYCDNCGAENRDTANFCYNCRQDLIHLRNSDTPKAAVATGEVSTPPVVNESAAYEQFSRILGGRYELQELIGQGGMGLVYRAYDRQLGMDVAIKFLPECFVDDFFALESLKREAKATMQLAHPNIMRLYNFEDTPQAKYLLMEFIRGESLAAIGSRKPDSCFSESEVVKYISEVCEALEYAHNAGIIHRDIKPGNILLATDGHIKLADFGVAHIRAAAGSQKSGGGGTPIYMSPEQILDNDMDCRSDIYSLGVTMYEMLAGRRPFSGPDVGYHHIHTMPDPIEGVSEWMNAIVFKCLKKEPESRWQSAEELRDVLSGKKEIDVPFKAKFQSAWARAEADRMMAAPKTPPPDPAPMGVESPGAKHVTIDKTPSPFRYSGLHDRLVKIERHAGLDQHIPEREQARMGIGLVAGVAVGIAMNFLGGRSGWTESADFLFRMSWLLYGALIGLSVGIAQKRVGKAVLSSLMGVVGGLSAVLLLMSVPDAKALAGREVFYSCIACGSALGVLLGAADGIYERSIVYVIRCMLWGAAGGVLAVAVFWGIRYLFSSFWSPTLTWIFLGAALGFFINMFVGFADRPWESVE